MLKSILNVIDSGIKYLTLLLKTSSVRRMKKAIDYAERFLFLSKDLEKEKNMGERKRIRKRMASLRKAFFKYN